MDSRLARELNARHAGGQAGIEGSAGFGSGDHFYDDLRRTWSGAQQGASLAGETWRNLDIGEAFHKGYQTISDIDYRAV